MPVDFQHLRSGEGFRYTQRTVNAMIDAGEQFNRTAGGDLSAPPPGYEFQGDIVYVKNTTGYDMPRFSVGGLSACLITPTDNINEFCNYPRFNVRVPVVPDDVSRFCVLIEPLADGKIGRALVSGVVQCKVWRQAYDVAPTFVNCCHGHIDYLYPSAGGAAVLYCEPRGGSDGPVWALVRLAQYSTAYGVAQSDWHEGGTRPADPYVSVKYCADRFGNGVMGTAFDVYLPRSGDGDPNVYGPHSATSDWPAYAGDIIQWTFGLDGIPVAVGSYMGERLGTVKYFNGPFDKVPYGWHITDGSDPDGNKLGHGLPDSRGRYTRATDKSGSDQMWTDTGAWEAVTPGADKYVGPADNTGADAGDGSDVSGGRTGVGIKKEELSNCIGADTFIATELKDVRSWNAPPRTKADGDATPEEWAVVAPPTYIFTQIIRCI